MSKAHIKAISYITASKAFNNDDLVKEFPEWSVDKVASKIGISNRFIAGDDESTSDLGVLASEKLFTEHNINRDIIQKGIDTLKHQRLKAKLAEIETPRKSHPSLAMIG